jgi:hypothetical protein
MEVSTLRCVTVKGNRGIYSIEIMKEEWKGWFEKVKMNGLFRDVEEYVRGEKEELVELYTGIVGIGVNLYDALYGCCDAPVHRVAKFAPGSVFQASLMADALSLCIVCAREPSLKYRGRM